MIGFPNGLGLTTILGAVAAALTVTVPAQATQTAGSVENFAPIRPANQAMTRMGQFVLNSDSDVELMRFSKPHDVEVCLPHRMDVRGRPSLQGAEQYRIIVNWDKQTGEIWPGNCLTFDAAKLKVSPSPDMPKGAHVVGNIRVY